MTIRRASVEDTAIIHEIGCRSYRHNFLNIWSPKGLENHLEQNFNPKLIENSLRQTDIANWFLISPTHQSSPVGFTAIFKNSPVPGLELKRPALELQKLYFLPEASGLGLGKQLMDFAVSFAADNAYDTLWLDVLKSNEGAIRFYQRHKFEKIGELSFATDIKNVGQWVMLKNIAI